MAMKAQQGRSPNVTEDKTEAAMPENPESRGNEPSKESKEMGRGRLLRKQREGGFVKQRVK